MNDDDRREPPRMLVVEASLRVDSISARLAQLHRAFAHASSENCDHSVHKRFS